MISFTSWIWSLSSIIKSKGHFCGIIGWLFWKLPKLMIWVVPLLEVFFTKVHFIYTKSLKYMYIKYLISLILIYGWCTDTVVNTFKLSIEQMKLTFVNSVICPCVNFQNWLLNFPYRRSTKNRKDKSILEILSSSSSC